MGIDFDILEHCRKARADHGPPYTCPVEKCGRNYKSVCGLQYHLKSYDHDNPTPLPPSTPNTPKNKKGRSRISTAKIPATPNVPEPLTFDEAQKMVQFEVNNIPLRWNINDCIEIVPREDFSDEDNHEVKVEAPSEPIPCLPTASYKIMEDYNICDAPARPNAYIRFIEKSTEELDGEVEYDLDEEDTAWLSIMNEKRESTGLASVSVDSLELLMDRLEKESYFQASVNGHTGAVVDDDAVCCICMDGECQNTNVILFCDMCNLAVHQDCYGVPYIPEGQWLCRRCLQSPSRAVDCVLCPNQGGAFKQTDRSQWAHVVCALWIPEVRFANTVFLEPIDSIETIPAARWKLTCYVCKQKGVGACIQCHKTNCYSAFHVTCAQQAGLYMKMDTVKDGGDTQPVLVQKIAYCDAHAPAESKGESKKEDPRQKMQKVRKMLAKKRTSAPVILIPTIPPERIQEIGSLVTITKKSQFIQRLIAYWTLKRQFRNGVPLLRRLQSAQGGTRDSNTSNVDTLELCRQLKYWQCLRQDLERARLLCELVRKREKMKLEYTKVSEKCMKIKLKPLEASLKNVLDLVASKDSNEIFSEPVDLEEVPDYTTVVTDPMDLSTMYKKLDQGLYPDLLSIEKDFNLMIANCLAYNNKDTVFYRAGVKMRDQCAVVFRQAKRDLQSAGLMEVEVAEGGKGKVAPAEDCIAGDIDKKLELLQGKTGPDIITQLEDLLSKSHALKHSQARMKRVKLIRSELNKAKKALATTEESQSDREVEVDHKIDSPNPNASPSGVNRRNAVLFTRKAQAALKKPEVGGGEEKQEKTTFSFSPIKSKKKGKKNRGSSQSPSKTEEATAKDPNVPDSFRVYRAGNVASADEDSDSGTSLSTCYSHETSEVESDEEEEEEEGGEGSNASESDEEATRGGDGGGEKVDLKPLTLVWAKCRGYPWYPALIIDPEMPKGYVHQGVPMPSPPAEVMALSSKFSEHVYLVLFFDVKRTWQWLPADKLELLGLDTEKDLSKVNEPRKPTDRKAVKKAYENALQYQSQINEPPGPDAIA
ncbi:unnamed protein product [Brassicogethes aeneus]|uniref:Peregrin n=1 Tax=Brassicogethes aeneus TaxID=1431903 RepID=A0A9P0AV16_BRAAE|nr:unnamed protein product [Brassicogethes aeneus]